MNLTLINLAMAGYLLACIFYLIHSIFKIQNFGRIATTILSIGFICHTLYWLARWYFAGHPPLAGLFNTLVFFVWAIAAVYLIVERIYKFRPLGIPVSFIGAIVLGYASILDKSLKPLMPALKSNWLVIHVSSYFIGYAAVALSFFSSLIYLVIPKKPSENSRLAERLDDLSYRLIALAFPFLTIGLTTGAVWAKVAWGAYWSWDPKETWALITWLIYAAYLHLRVLKNWQGPKAAYLNIIGFLCLLFTFLGVNYLLKGLHSYI